MSDIKNLYNNLTNFYNVNDENFKEFMAEFYKLTNESIKKNEIQSDLIRELQRMFEEFNENGIDENIIREKVDYFIQNNTEIENINKQLEENALELNNYTTTTHKRYSQAMFSFSDDDGDTDLLTTIMPLSKELNVRKAFSSHM